MEHYMCFYTHHTFVSVSAGEDGHLVELAGLNRRGDVSVGEEVPVLSVREPRSRNEGVPVAQERGRKADLTAAWEKMGVSADCTISCFCY